MVDDGESIRKKKEREREEYNKELPLAWMLKRAWSRKKKNQPVIPYFVWAANRNLSPTMISPRSAMEWKTRKRGSERQQEREGRMRERERERGVVMKSKNSRGRETAGAARVWQRETEKGSRHRQATGTLTLAWRIWSEEERRATEGGIRWGEGGLVHSVVQTLG